MSALAADPLSRLLASVGEHVDLVVGQEGVLYPLAVQQAHAVVGV